MTQYIYTLECYFDTNENRRMVRVHRGSFEENRDSLNPQMIEAREISLHHQLCTPTKHARKFAKEMKSGLWHF